MFEDTKKRIVDEIKSDIVREMKHDLEEEARFDPDGVVNLDAHREIEALVKSRLGAAHVVMSAQMLDGTVLTYIPEEIGDKDLVYLIQTLHDLRQARLDE